MSTKIVNFERTQQNLKSFSERLKSARLMRGLSLEGLADKLEPKVSRQALHKYEQGTARPGSDVLTALCKVLDIPPDFFARQSVVKLDNLSFRKKASLGAKEETRVRETARDYLERYLELEQLVGKLSYLTDNPLKALDIKSLDDVEKAAGALRLAWNLGDDPLYNVLELLEDHQVKVIPVTADEKFSGFSTWVDTVPVIVINQNDQIPLDRLRFTALHELGHLLLDLNGHSEKEKEFYCHAFAGAMLIPVKRLIDELGYRRYSIHIKELGVVKQQYGISIAALLRRAKETGVLTPNGYRIMLIQLSKQGYRTTEPFAYQGQEKAQRFTQLLIQAFTQEVITTSKAAALNNQSLGEFRKNLASDVL